MKKPIISHFKEKPKYAVTWWAMGLGLASLLEIPLLALFSALTRRLAAVEFGSSIGIVGILLSVAALVTGTIAYRKGERSWVLWLGFGPALALGLFWGVAIIAEVISAIYSLGF